MLSLCAERSRADGFDQIDGLGAGDERGRFAVHGGKAILAVIAVERQRERRESLVIQMQRQRNLFLSVRLFVREADGGQRTQRGAADRRRQIPRRHTSKSLLRPRRLRPREAYR